MRGGYGVARGGYGVARGGYGIARGGYGLSDTGDNVVATTNHLNMGKRAKTLSYSFKRFTEFSILAFSASSQLLWL